MSELSVHADSRLTAIILAGGDGMRLQPLMRMVEGHDLPKQFFALDGQHSLLEMTRSRVRNLVPDRNTVIVVNRSHARHYHPILSDVPAINLIEQPGNCGTAPAIAYALCRLCRKVPDAIVTIFPSDHFISNDKKFMRNVEIAIEAVRSRPALWVTLGIRARAPETSYGWIEPGAAIGNNADRILQVERFWEKPNYSLAEKLKAKGCYWNSFVMCARAEVLLFILAERMPRVYRALREATGANDSEEEADLVAGLYADLEPVGFSENVLAAAPSNLAVRPVDDVEWSDLGEPGRVVDAVSSAGLNPAWLTMAKKEISRSNSNSPNVAYGGKRV